MLRQESWWTKVSGFSEPELLKQQGKAEQGDEKLWECYCNQKQTGRLPPHWTFLWRNCFGAFIDLESLCLLCFGCNEVAGESHQVRAFPC